MIPVHFESLYPKNSRFKEIEKLLSFIKSGLSAQVVGLPGVGKSNILRLLAYNRNVRIAHLGGNQKKYHFVYMDFSQVRKRPLFDVNKFIFLELINSLADRGLVEKQKNAKSVFEERFKFGDEFILFQGLKETLYRLTLDGFNIVLLFDRFAEFTQSATAEFFNNLRALRNQAKYHFSCVFSLNRPLEETLDAETLADFYEFVSGNTVFVPLFDKEGFEFRLSYFEKSAGKKLDKALVKGLLEATGGHGKLTRIGLEILGKNGGATPQSLSSRLLSEKAILGALSEIWVSLLPQEQAALLKKERNEYLENIGLVQDSKIKIALFEEFIKNQRIGGEIVYDETRNEILKNGEPLSNILSPAEFRLLRFLLKNRGRLCEKDEIINAVWSDTKTQEGVTDQALEQIVYRLRKKIEENPNTPKHILTIKGRGYRVEG